MIDFNHPMVRELLSDLKLSLIVSALVRCDRCGDSLEGKQEEIGLLASKEFMQRVAANYTAVIEEHGWQIGLNSAVKVVLYCSRCKGG